MSIPIGHLLVVQDVTRRELNSARPDAPVVPDGREAPARLRRTRSATASALNRAAARIAPAC